MLTRESYSLNKPSTRMSAKKAIRLEIHHQTISARVFFFSRWYVCVLFGVSSSTFSTINIIPRVRLLLLCYWRCVFFSPSTCNRNMAFCLMWMYHLIDIQIQNVWMPLFFRSSFFVVCFFSLSLCRSLFYIYRNVHGMNATKASAALCRSYHTFDLCVASFMIDTRVCWIWTRLFFTITILYSLHMMIT